MKKVYIDLTVRLILNLDEGVEIDDVINEMYYDFAANSHNADILDTEITDYSVVDSK